MPYKDGYTSAMVVVAHPDDAEFGFSGTIAKWCMEGMDVFYVLCTDGSHGTSDRELPREELAQIRAQEQRNACKALGVKDVVFLDHEDGYLQPTLELRKEISREIRRYKPDVLICQNPARTLDGRTYVGHPDHQAAGEATLSALFPSARDHLTFPELLDEGFEPHKTKEVLISGHPQPDVWIDVSDSMETAIKAIMEHKSQVGDRDQEQMSRRMKDGRGQNGFGRGMKYAESFKSFTFRT